MLEHAQALKTRGVPTFVDPSHGLPLLDRGELLSLIDGAAAYVVNDYEWSLTLETTGVGEEEIAARCGAVIITRGEQGSEIREGGRRIEIPAVASGRVIDPTGCGDAYRAGLLFGRARGLSWEIAGRIGSLLGSYQVEVEGTQSLGLVMDDFRSRYRREFDADFA
jgi:adenosine kinase